MTKKINKNINNYNQKTSINNRIKYYYYKYNLKTNSIENSKNDINENIFTSILRSLSSDNKLNDGRYYGKIRKKSSQINILTMLELNSKIKSKKIKK